MKLKRVSIIVLCLILTLTFCGCGDKKEGGKDSGKGSTASVDEITFEGLKFETNKDLDFGGKTVKIARYPAIPEPGLTANYDREIAIKEVMEEKYNVKVEWIKYSSEDELLKNLVLNHTSGTAWADLVFTTTPFMLSALNNEGVFRAVDDYIDFSNDRFKLTDTATKYVDGKHYSYYPTKYDAGYFIYYNTTLLAENNCEDPRELYDAGKWNWEAFEKIAKACTKVKSGKTIYGVAGSNILDGMLASNGKALVSSDIKNNTAICNIFTDEGKNALEFVRTLAYTDKAVDGTYGTHNGIETFNNGFAAMLVGPQYYGSHLVQTGIPYEMVPLPLGKDVKSYTNLCQYCYCYSISAHSEFKTEDLLQLAFELERNDPEIEGTYREDDYEGKLGAFVEEYLDQANHYYDETQAQFVYDFINKEETVNLIDWVTTDISSIIAEKVYKPIYKGEDVRSHLTSVEPVIKAELDKQF